MTAARWPEGRWTEARSESRRLDVLANALGELRICLEPVRAPNPRACDADATQIPDAVRRAYTASLTSGYSPGATLAMLTALLERMPRADAGCLARASAKLAQLRARELAP
jgi:hypothetical protein